MKTYTEETTLAANLERMHSYQEAAEAWHAAYYLARRPANREWCLHREHFCQHAWRWAERGVDHLQVA